ncbi:hypothetical protein F511_23186 [Dorcoceras hygrometricum]|uniref:Uncharacterized protein n=1 Tax=Dorcoceras hygrometricum TaxID=472368 RepID=A0A2Z7BEY1_9LAMI|nr:hypothetical protein F511_23186 [Dorcoceras hygrometricum]
MRHHADRGLLQKHKSDLHPDRPCVFYQWLRYDVTRIIVFCKIINFSSGPDLILTQSYTSILHLGLAAGDTPDAPHYHLGTRGPSPIHQMPSCTDCYPAGRGADPARGAPQGGSRLRRVVVPLFRERSLRSLPSQPQQQQQPQVAQQSGRQRFRPRGQQFKKNSGSGSSGSGISSSSGSRAEFCGDNIPNLNINIFSLDLWHISSSWSVLHFDQNDF